MFKLILLGSRPLSVSVIYAAQQTFGGILSVSCMPGSRPRVIFSVSVIWAGQHTFELFSLFQLFILRSTPLGNFECFSYLFRGAAL